MARVRYFNFRDPDSTLLFNDRFRAILRAGVYAGFNVGLGSGGGFKLKFTHDPDPDNTGEVIGKFITHDGVIVEENADQDDVVTGQAPGAADEIHYVVASYVYNQALPANDVAYFVKTAVAPATPTLTDDEILLAEIDVPASAADYSTSDIKTIQKLDLYGVSNVIKDYFTGIIDPGIYEGMEIIKGSGDLDITLNAGVWITKETRDIVEAADQIDLLTITNPGAGLYRYAWVVGMHKDELTDPIPDVDYILVEGTAVVVGSAATLPTDSDILTAAAAVDAKYDDADYINKLGYVRCENRGGTYYIEYIRGETILDDNTIVVYGAEARSLNRSGKYFGHQGLIEAINDIYALTEESSDSLNIETPYTILLDGRFKFGDEPLRVPSHIKLQGLGAPVVLESDYAGDVIRAQGFEAYYNGSNDTVTQASGATSPPSGYVSRNFEIQSTYRSGDDLVARKLTYGDKVIANSDGGGVTYYGYVVRTVTTSNNWTVEVFIDQDYNIDGNPTDLYFVILKRNLHFEDIQIRPINTGDGQLSFELLEECSIDGTKVEDLVVDRISNCRVKSIEVSGSLSWNATIATLILNDKNIHGRIRVTGSTTPVTFNEGDGSYIDLLEYSNQNVTITFNSKVDRGRINSVRINGASSSVLNIQGYETSYGKVLCQSGTVKITGDQNSIAYVRGVVLEFDTGSTGNAVLYGDYSTFTDTAADASNRVLLSTSSTHFDEVAEMPHSDRNLRLVSLATVSWDESSGVLTWDDPLKFDNPWTSGYSQIDAGNATLSTDGDRLYADIARDATGTTVVGVTVRAKASAASDRYTKNRVFVALRDQGVIYLFDGTRIEDGQSVQIGSTPPPDGSITYQKFSTATGGANADSLLYLNKFLRDYVSEDDTDYWTPDIVVRNTGLATIAYTTATGVIQYTGTIDLAPAETLFNAGVPLYVILRNLHQSSSTANSREAVLAINAASKTVTIAKGLGALVLGAANVWNGAIGRNGMVVSNDDLVSFTYDPDGTNPGRVTYSSSMNFNNTQVQKGFIFVDSSGSKYPITSVDASGNFVTIPPGLRTVDDSAPSDKTHGSIITGHNPLEINLSDAKCLYGAEFIPVDFHGPRAEKYSERLQRYWSTVGFGDKLMDVECRTIRPFDKRVHLWVHPANRSADMGAVDIYISSTMDYGKSETKYVQVTGVYTGIALIVSRSVDSGSVSWDATVDGESVGATLWSTPVDYDTVYGVEQGRYDMITTGELTRLYQGPHTTMFEVDDTTRIRGVLLVNHNLGANSGKALDCPGTIIKKGGVVAKTYPSLVDLPAAPTYDKGRRLVRYLNSSGSLAWAESQVRNHSETVDIDGTVTVTNVNTDEWRVGDIVMFINSTTQRRWLHRVTAKGAGTLTISPAAGFTATTTAYYYGHGFQDDADNLAYMEREYEEATYQANMAEFASNRDLTASRSCIGRPTARQTFALATRMNDGAHGIVGGSGGAGFTNEAGGGFKMDTQDDEVRIWFVGTGLAIMRKTSTGTVDVAVDGVTLPSMARNDQTGFDHDTDDGGTYVCGDLPYGSHYVYLTVTDAAVDTVINSITVYGPKRPEFDGVPILDTILTGASEHEMGIDNHNGSDFNGVDEVQFGTINYDLGNFCHPISAGVATILQDAAGNPANQVLARYGSYINGAAGDSIDIVFFGDEITLVTGDIALNTGSITVKFKDNDNTFKIYSSITGFTITSTTSTTTLPTHATSARRFRWEMDLGFHIMRLDFGDGTETIELDSIEIGTPFHNHISKLPITWDRLQPLCHGGMDIRPLTPFQHSLVPGHQDAYNIPQGMYRSITTPVIIENQQPFIFYSHGGLVEIDVSFRVTDDAAGATVQMAIDGVEDGPTVEIAAAATENGTINRVVALAPGMHWAYIITDAPSADTVERYQWRVRQATIQTSRIPSQGQAAVIPGPGGRMTVY